MKRVLLAFLALRALQLFTAVELLSFDEELYRGTIALELVDGPKAGLWDYQADDYSGGSLVVGLLAAPLFALLGPRLLALKLVPLAFSLATLVLLFIYLRHLTDERTALLGGALFVLSPPAFTQLSWLAMGFHSESLLFSMLLLLAFERLGWDGRFRGSWLVAFGVLSGLGFWFTYITALTTLACLVAWLARRSGNGRRDLLPLVVSLTIGLTPWLAYNLIHGFAGLNIPSVEWPLEASESMGTRLRFLLERLVLVPGIGLPYSLGFPTVAGLPGPLLDFLYCAIAALAVASALGALRRRLTPAMVPLWVYPGIFLLAYVVTGVTIPHGGHIIETRYFPPLHLIGLIIVTVALVHAPAGRLLAALLLALGALGQGTLVFQHSAPGVLHYAGVSYGQLGFLWQSRRPLGVENADQLWPRLAAFRPDRARLVFSGFVDGGFAQWAGDLARMPRFVAETPVAYRTLLAEGLGYAAGLRHGADAGGVARAVTSAPEEGRDHFFRGLSGGLAAALAERPAEYLERIAAVGVPYRHHFYTSLGVVLRRCYASRPSEPCPTAVPPTSGFDGEAQAAFYRGLGQASVAIRSRDEGSSFLLFVADVVPPTYHGDFFWGMGWAVREVFTEDRARAVDWIGRLPVAGRPRALEGLRACEAWYRLEAP